MLKVRWFRVLLGLVLVFLTVGVGGYLVRETLFITFLYSGSRADWELQQLRNRATFEKEPESDVALMDECLAIAREHPGTRTELAAYLYAEHRWPDQDKGIPVFDELMAAAEDYDLDDWANALNDSRNGASEWERWTPLAARLVDRIEREPDHAAAARLLTELAVLLNPEFAAESAPPELLRIANLVAERFAASPDLANFCEVAADLYSSAHYTKPFEPYVRQILSVNQDRYVRCSASLALASIVRAHGASRQDEARQLYQTFLTEFNGQTVYPAQGVEEQCRQWAFNALEVMDNRGFGMTAPETRGIDLDGDPIALEDFRGRVVLLSFWASWCPPCLKAVPLELELLHGFEESEFAIVGLNADDVLENAAAAVNEHGIVWPSFRKSSHEEVWPTYGYPTYYLMDREGKIAGYWLGTPSKAELEEKIRFLVEQ